jgi:hypothetical protein
MSIYVEENCAVTFEGRTYESGGAYVSPEHIIAYPGSGGILNDWHGRPLGTWRIAATWPTPNSWISRSMHQIEATVDGVTYTGRGRGEGMIFKGRRKRA